MRGEGRKTRVGCVARGSGNNQPSRMRGRGTSRREAEGPSDVRQQWLCQQRSGGGAGGEEVQWTRIGVESPSQGGQKAGGGAVDQEAEARRAGGGGMTRGDGTTSRDGQR